MTRHALILACENYSNFANISFCCSDAFLIQETLTEYCDYESDMVEIIIPYIGCDETPFTIYEKIDSIIENAEQGDTVLFYYAGHGAKEGDKGYLLLPDSISSDYQNTALDLAKVNELLKNPKVDSFLILDACHSGISARSILNFSIADIIEDTGCVTLASCSENEESHPYPEKEDGVFTFYLCEEIKKTTPGTPIYIENLKMEVCRNVAKWAKKNYKQQTPTLIGQVVGNKAFALRDYKTYNSLESQVIDDETEVLYTDVLKRWLKDNTKLRFKSTLSINKDWRIFGQCYVYSACDEDDKPCIIMIHIMKKYNYSNVFHAFNNLCEINKYYTKFGEKYNYYQLIVTPKEMFKDLYKMIETHTKLKRIFNNREVKNTILYLREGEFHYLFSNYM